jgi:ubiquinone/menaquinone biosynthesis C-methylase UbiE
MIGRAEKLNPKIDFRVDNMFNLNISDNFFAGICSFYAIVNFRYDDIKKIFKEYYRVLIEDGLLLISFHVEEKEVHVENFFESGKPLDFYFFDENIVMDILKKTGYKIKEALVRFPYEKEYPSKRAYIFAKK